MVNFIVFRIGGLERFVLLALGIHFGLNFDVLPGTCSKRWKRMRETLRIDLILFTFENFHFVEKFVFVYI